MREQRAPARSPAAILAYDLETIAPGALGESAFPPWPRHRVIAAGFARAERRDGDWAFDLAALVADGEDDEGRLIREADRQLAITEVATTYNGRGFDAVVLRAAALRCRLFNLSGLAAHSSAPRFANEHVDLADLLASHGAAKRVALAEICEPLGIPVKTVASGADVAALWAAGDRERIGAYVLEDAVVALILYFVLAGFQAADETLVVRPLAALARHIEERPALDSLQPLCDCALLRWARPRALQADVVAALNHVSTRLRRLEDEHLFASS